MFEIERAPGRAAILTSYSRHTIIHATLLDKCWIRLSAAAGLVLDFPCILSIHFSKVHMHALHATCAIDLQGVEYSYILSNYRF